MAEALAIFASAPEAAVPEEPNEEVDGEIEFLDLSQT